MSISPTVAIVGAGPAGLVSARWTLHYGMRPTLFEKANAVGGLWHLKTEEEVLGIKWPSNKTSISRYSCEFHGLPHDKNTGIFLSREQMGAYLQRYAETFGIVPHVRLGHRVVATEPIEDDLTETRWRVRFRNSANEEHTEEFDRLVVSTG